MICLRRLCGNPFQNLCTTFSCTHAQTDGHQDGLTAVITLGLDTNLIAPVLGKAVNGKAFFCVFLLDACCRFTFVFVYGRIHTI